MARQAKSEAAIAKGVNDFLRHDLLEEASPDKNARDKQVTVEEVVRPRRRENRRQVSGSAAR